MVPLPSSILGHRKQLDQLGQDLESRNITHSYLFSGPKHLGKFSIARCFAAQLLTDGLNEEQRQIAIEQIERMIHPDLLILDRLWIEDQQENWAEIAQYSNVPQEHRAKDAKARTDTISIDDVRALGERLVDTGSSKYFCCLIRSIERMQPVAANAFLKLLEEPPPRVVFVLTTENESALLPTVLSRCRRLKFYPVPRAEMKTLFETFGQANAHMNRSSGSDTRAVPRNSLSTSAGVSEPRLRNIDEDDAQLLLHLAEGAPGKLMALLADAELMREEKQLHAQAKQFWQMPSTHQRFQWLAGSLAGSKDTSRLLLHLGLTLRELDDAGRKVRLAREYNRLVSGLHTNANPGLLLQRFGLAVSAV